MSEKNNYSNMEELDDELLDQVIGGTGTYYGDTGNPFCGNAKMNAMANAAQQTGDAGPKGFFFFFF